MCDWGECWISWWNRNWRPQLPPVPPAVQSPWKSENIPSFLSTNYITFKSGSNDPASQHLIVRNKTETFSLHPLSDCRILCLFERISSSETRTTLDSTCDSSSRSSGCATLCWLEVWECDSFVCFASCRIHRCHHDKTSSLGMNTDPWPFYPSTVEVVTGDYRSLNYSGWYYR